MTDQETPIDPGQAAYMAHAEASLARVDAVGPLLTFPPWDHLSLIDRNHWHTVARAARGVGTTLRVSPRVHDLKAWPEQWEATCSGAKPFEFRKNDRDYRVGDVLLLSKYDPETGLYFEDREPLVRWVAHIEHGDDGHAFGIPDGYCVMGLTTERP